MKHLTTDELATKCRKESGRSGQQQAGQASACWELFRRAFDKDDQQALQALYDQYRRLIVMWGQGSGLEPNELVQESFVRLWQALRSREFAVCFPTTGTVMKFLKLCTRSTVIDNNRQRERQPFVETDLTEELTPEERELFENVILKNDVRQKFRAYLNSRLLNQDERLFLQLKFELHLTPKEIVAKYPDQFPNPKIVYRFWERIVSRLRNDPMAQKWKEDLF